MILRNAIDRTTVERARSLMDVIGGADLATVQLGQTEVSVGEYEPADHTPSHEQLEELRDAAPWVDLCSSVHQRFASSLGEPLPDAIWWRTRHHSGTREHMDIEHFESFVRKERRISRTMCLFCGAERDGKYTCQRCRGGGLWTVWVPLHDIDARMHSALVFSTIPTLTRAARTIRVGDVLVFDGETPHAASAGLDPRHSVDFRFLSSTLGKFPYELSSHAGRVLRAYEAMLDDAGLRKRELHNNAFLASFLALPSSAERRMRHILQGADVVYQRAARARLEAVQPPATFQALNTAQLFWEWLVGPSPAETLRRGARALLAAGKPVRMTSDGRLYRVSEGPVLFATHLAFCATDYLLSPWRFEQVFTEAVPREYLREYLGNAFTLLHKHRDFNVELYLETRACVSALITPMLVQSHWVDDAEWDQVLHQTIERESPRRHAADIHIHAEFLRAWEALVSKMVL